MGRRKEFEKYPICIIKHPKTGMPKLAYKTQSYFVNYHNLQTRYPISSQISKNNATKQDYYLEKSEFKKTEIDAMKNEKTGGFKIPKNKAEKKIIKRNCNSLVISVFDSPKLVYDIGGSYLNAHNLQTTYPKDSPVILGQANKKTFKELKNAGYFNSKIIEMNDTKITSENWFKVVFQKDIRRLIDDITNGLSSNRSNVNEVIRELEYIRDVTEQKILPINSVFSLINERLLEVARKATVKNKNILCSDKTRKLLYDNNVYGNKLPSWIKYRVNSFTIKKTGERKYRIAKRDQYGEWTDYLKNDDGSWLTFNTFESAREQMLKIAREENKIDDEENLETIKNYSFIVSQQATSFSNCIKSGLFFSSICNILINISIKSSTSFRLRMFNSPRMDPYIL